MVKQLWRAQFLRKDSHQTIVATTCFWPNVNVPQSHNDIAEGKRLNIEVHSNKDMQH